MVMTILLMNMITTILRAAEALPEPVAGPMPQPEADAHYGYYGYGLIWIWMLTMAMIWPAAP